MRQWEYLSKVEKTEDFTAKCTEIDWLNIMGRNGWELVSRKEIGATAISFVIVKIAFIFKREKEQTLT